ncbi:MAG: chemotaxis protein [Gammaproteobacteria bacterium]|nr:chemotaxis protein [Gammaproteobacteria bacterium]
MANVLSKVDERTQLVGHNRLELLLFRLDGKQRYGINVFKVREVISCPTLTRVPHSHPAVIGLANLRGQTISVIDIQMAVGKPKVEDVSHCSVIVTEYNRSVQGFLVPKIEHIVNKNWDEVQMPPAAAGKGHFLTAVTRIDDELIEILDVERVLFDVTGQRLDEAEADSVDEDFRAVAAQYFVLVADDSSVARHQIERTMKQTGVDGVLVEDGAKALKLLQQWRDNEPDKLAKLALVISDVEMPEMDGYTLTSNIRRDPKLRDLKVLLHTSLSGVFNSSLLEQVQADGFLSKFDREELGEQIRGFVTEFAKAH